MRRSYPRSLVLVLLVVCFQSPARAGKIETNVTLSSYWVSNYKYFHSPTFVTLQGMTGDLWPTTKFECKLRSDFVGPMTVAVDWQHVTKRQLMSVRGMSWGQVDFGDGVNGGPNKAWAWKIDSAGKKTPIKGVWYLYVDRDIRPGSYPKIQLMPQTRPANWYRGYKISYFQVPFPVMVKDYTRPIICANNGDFLPMGACFKVTRPGTNLHNVPAMAELFKHKFAVFDIGVGGRGMDVHQGLQCFEAEDMDKYSLFMPGATCRDTRGATIEVLGQYQPDGKFVWWDNYGKPVRVGAPPAMAN
jgi:hypothetical protein